MSGVGGLDIHSPQRTDESPRPGKDTMKKASEIFEDPKGSAFAECVEESKVGSQVDGSALNEVERRIKALFHYVQIEVARDTEERSKLLRTIELAFEPIAEMKKQNDNHEARRNET